MAAPRHVFRIHIRATPEEVWQAITDPEFTRQYFHHTAFESTLEPGSPMRFVMADGTDAVVGEIEEVDPPHRLVMTWRALYDAAMADEPSSRVEWQLDDGGEGVTQVTTIHRDLAMSPVTSVSVGTGWIWILDSMKSLLETGAPLPGSEPELAPVDDADGEWHRAMGVEANNSTWELLERDQLSPDEVDDLLGRAYASTFHWRRAARRSPENQARGSWLVSHVHSVLGHGELALHHADRCAAIVADAGLEDFDLAYAHEARARAFACLGRLDEARVERDAAGAVPIADDEDRKIFAGDLATGPWFGLIVDSVGTVGS
jgi:uncharacterized protein YndB with AHSA1/START domain